MWGSGYPIRRSAQSPRTPHPIHERTEMPTTKSPKATKQAEVAWQPYAECLTKDCDWQHQMSKHTLADAKYHAEVNNHKIRTIKETVAVYCRSDYDKANDKDAE